MQRGSDSGWALVTGASAGLGEEFARALARRGRDVVLVARREDRLRRLAEELDREHGVRTLVVATDLLDADAGARLESELARAGVHVETFVNNAGFGAQGAFVELDRERQLDLVRLNSLVATDLAHRFAAPMAERGRGHLLNVASTASFVPGPGMAAYYASKAFVLSLSEALSAELAPRGVVVTCLCPGPTDTEFRSVAGRPRSALLDRIAARPGPVVEAGLRGLERGRAVVVPGVANKLATVAVRFVPRWFVRRAVARVQSALPSSRPNGPGL
ncbi:MAG: SDR family oxidoreductase [Planctomycetota bacterium]